MTGSHWVRASKQEQSFLDGLVVVRNKDGNQKWASLLVEVPNPNKTNSRVGSEHSEMVPKVFVVLAGGKSQKKIELVNAMLCDWQVDLKKKKTPKGKNECPYYANGFLLQTITHSTPNVKWMGYMMIWLIFKQHAKHQHNRRKGKCPNIKLKLQCYEEKYGSCSALSR